MEKTSKTLILYALARPGENDLRTKRSEVSIPKFYVLSSFPLLKFKDRRQKHAFLAA